MAAVKQQQLERSQERPGPPVTGAASETPATSTAITATFDVFERMEACEREGTLRHADQSAKTAIEFGMDSSPEKKEKKRKKCAISLWKPLSTAWTRVP